MERVCRRCLVGELGDAELKKTIAEYVASLPAEAKTPEKLYRERLEICRACESLAGGMCRICGCFVETRAARVGLCCPAPAGQW